MKGNRANKPQVLVDYAFTHSFGESVQLILETTAAEVGCSKGMLVVFEEEDMRMYVAATVGELAPARATNNDPPSVKVAGEPDANDWFKCILTTTPIVSAGPCRSPEWPFFGADDATVPTAIFVPFMTPVRARAALAFFGRSHPFGKDDQSAIEQITYLPLRIAFEERRLFALREIRPIYDSVADVLFTLSIEPDDVFRFTSVNRSFLETTGLSRDAVIGKDFREVIPAESQELVLTNYRKAVRERRTTRWEEVSEFAVGRRFGEVTVTPVVDSHGRCTHLIGTVHDVTAYRSAVEELRATNDKYQTFFENSIDAILLLSTDGDIIEANQAACEMFGRTQEELMKGGRKLIVDDTSPPVLALIDKRVQTGRAKGELLLRRKDGSLFPAEISSSVFNDSLGNLRIGMVIRDISERVAAQAEIQHSERYFRALIENDADIIMVLSVEGRVTYCSSSVKRQLGYEPELFEGARFRELDVVRMDPEAQTALDEVIHRAGVTLPISLTAATSSGDTRYLSGVARNAVDEEAVGGIVMNLRDVTVEMQYEKERERLRDELEQARKMESVGRLAGGVAHDFNNQLTVIMGHVELMLARSAHDEANHDDLVAVRTAAVKSAELTSQLLAFARRQSISPRLIDLNNAVEGMIRMLRRLIGEHIQLVWKPDRSIGSVKLDPVQVDQVLVNLCLNARDAIEDSGCITIATKRERLDPEGNEPAAGSDVTEYVKLSVSDDGVGMDAETLSRIFEPFFTTKPQGKGTGLGAATVYGIVQQNSGRIKVESGLGSGTTFDLYFPEQREAAHKAHGRQGGSSALGHGETILVVEDDRSILDTTSRVLESLEYHVLAFTDPLEAIAFLDGHPVPIHLIVTDVIMPGMNGRDLSERLTAMRPDVKTLFVSGYTADVIGVQGVLGDNVNFLEKPYRFDSLAAKVREILSS